MHFSEMLYTRPSLESAKAIGSEAIAALEASQNADEAKSVLLDWDKSQGLMESQVAMAN